MQTFLTNRIVAAALIAAVGHLSSVTVAHGDQHEPSAREQVEPTYDAVADFTHEQKNNVVAWFERRLADVETRKEKLAARSAEMRRDTEESLEKLRREIDQRTDEAQRELQDLKTASAEAWDGAKSDMKEALDRLEESLDAADEDEG